MNNPRISIITICLNDKVGLAKTMQSVLVQDYANIEYIVIDGESKDGSKEYLEQNTSKLSFWVSEKDSGIYDAMNKGITNASGDYCLFLNAGDYLAESNVISTFFFSESTADIVYGNLLFDRENKGLRLFKQPPILDLGYLYSKSPQHPASFIKRSLFDLYGVYDTSFKIAADYEFFLRVLIGHQVSSEYRDVTLTIFDTTGISSSVKHKTLEMEERKKALLNYLPKIVVDYLDVSHRFDIIVPNSLFQTSVKSKLLLFATKCFLKLVRMAN